MSKTDDRLDTLEAQVEAIKQAFRLMVKTTTFDAFRAQVGVLAKTVLEMKGGAATEEDDNPIKDSTPFPTGFSPSGGGGAQAGPPPASSPPPQAASTDSDDESVPNVVSGPATNVRPNLTNRPK